MRVLWLPMFSMRSHQTNKYSLLKDGNFQLTLARVLASTYEHVVIAVPNDTSDYREFLEHITPIVGPRVSFIKLQYGKNAAETRQSFWKRNASFFEERMYAFQYIVTDIPGYKGPLKHSLNLNVNTGAVPADVLRAEFTTVLNQGQVDEIVRADPACVGRVFTHTKVAHKALLPCFDSRMSGNVILWPFRISDKAYQFEQFIAAFEDQGLDKLWSIVITDPNESLKLERQYLTKTVLSKSQYYKALSEKPVVVMLDDIDAVLHPGTIELFHYGCPVLTYPSKLIPHYNQLQSLADLTTRLAHVCCNRVDVSDFVYAEGETDAYYSEQV